MAEVNPLPNAIFPLSFLNVCRKNFSCIFILETKPLVRAFIPIEIHAYCTIIMKFKTLLTLILLAVSQVFYAQQTPKTLLWKITGNGFTKPCYLFGTMHSQDKRVYYLGDSVYSGIRYCDGFAMEIDPGEYVDTFANSLENKQLDIGYKQLVENDLVKQKPIDYKESTRRFDSMLIKLRQRYTDISYKDIRRLEKAYRRRDKNDMRTALDLYLFDLAKKQGKNVGGIEDITDQTSLKDELGNSFDPDDFLKNQRKKFADVEEWMIATYVAADLDQLNEFSKQSQSKRQLSLVLNNRNYKMARRIDSLGKIRSTFCAVGAAHLPGDSGVISLLRKKGFTVSPVFSSKVIEPGDIKIDNRVQATVSITDADSNYIVQMPGKPTMLTSITNKLYVKTYKELSNDILLMCGVYEDGNVNKTVDKEVDDIKYFFSRGDIKLYSTNKINRQNIDGYDINFKGHQGYIRLQIFCNAGKTYMFAAGSKYKDSLNSLRCENFIASYKMILNRPPADASMLPFVCPEKAFSVLLPASPKKEIIQGDITVTKEDVTLFSSVDTKNKINYLVLLKEPFKGYFFDFDSSLFVQTVNEIKKGIIQTGMAVEHIMLDGYPALEVKITGEAEQKNYVIYAVLAIRQNRMYNLTARGLTSPGNELLFDKFINSFRFLPYLETRMDTQAGGDHLFSVTAPSPVHTLENKIFDGIKRTDYYCLDSNTAMSYGITAIGFSKYYWAGNVNAILNDYARNNFNDTIAIDNIFNGDSLVYKKNVTNGGIAGIELLMKSMANNSYTRLRILHYADSAFILNMKGDKELVINEDADIFFNSFRFTNENFSSTVFTSKTDLLIKDLQSADNNICTAAIEALRNDFKFPANDLQKLLDAFLYNYPPFKNKSVNQASALAATIVHHFNGKVLDFITTNYPLLKGKREDIRMQMLNILSASPGAETYSLLKQFILNDPPANADYTELLTNFSNAPAPVAVIFPALAVKLKDDNLAPFIIAIANMLIDSNKIQYNSISEYEEDILHTAKSFLKDYKAVNNDNFYATHTEAILQMLAKINQKSARTVLSGFLELRNINLTRVILLALARNNQTLPADQVDFFCADPKRRIELYNSLAAIGRQQFFKGEYASQHSFAEAFARIYTDNQVAADIPKYFDIAAIRDTVIDGAARRYYIFKLTCQYRRFTDYYTCITGPFSTDVSNLSIKEGEEKFILYKTPFDVKNIDHLFNDFIEKINGMGQ